MEGVHICEISQNGFWASLIYGQPILFIQIYVLANSALCPRREEKKKPKKPQTTSSSCLGTHDHLSLIGSTRDGQGIVSLNPFSISLFLGQLYVLG